MKLSALRSPTSIIRFGWQWLRHVAQSQATVHFLRIAIVLGTSLVTVEGCTRQDVSADGLRHNPNTVPHVLRIVEPQDFVTLNPHLYAATSLSMLSELTMAYLVRYDHRGRPVPELATEIPTQDNGGVSGDGKRIIFHLRHDARWSDGVPFSAWDVVFSVHVAQNPQNDEISRDGWNLIDRVEARGPYTVVMYLRQPYADFLPTFFGTAGANPCILPHHLLWRLPNINTAAYNSLPVGIGPFRYVRWRRGESVQLEANPYYFRGRPLLKRIEFRTIPAANTALMQLESGEADLWPLVKAGLYPDAKKIKTAVTQVIPGSYFSHIDFNLQRSIFSDRRVREALRLGTDREEVRRSVRHTTGSLQEAYAPPGTPAYDYEIPFHSYNVDQANKLLDDAGWQRGKDGVRVRAGHRLQLEFVIAADPDTEGLAELLRRMWQPLGIELNVRQYNTTVLFESRAHGGVLANGRFDITEFAWQSDVQGDLSDIYTCGAIPPRGQNYSGYCNPVVDRLYDQMKSDYNLGHRKQLLSQIQRLIVDDVPTIVLSMNDDIYTESGDLHNFHPNAFSPFDDMMGVDIY
jgi:peptide/nickel transport system substrate-binding protein